MEPSKTLKISRKKAKRNFTTIGLILFLYVLLVMFIPFGVREYMLYTNSDMLYDEYLYYGVYFLLIVFGTVIPFFLMRKFAKISLKRINRNISATFIDLFVQTIVFFTSCIILTYVSTMIFIRFGLEGKLICSIAFSYDISNLSNYLYIFMLLVVTPILEEYAFRGVLLNTLGKYGKTFGLYASSIIFALAHCNFAEMLPAFAMGIALGKTSLRYKSIKPTIIIHILFNALIYGLCIIPDSVSKYLAYLLVGISVIAFILIITGRYEMIKVQKLKSNKTTNILFYTRPTIIMTIIAMIIFTVMFMLIV